MADHVRVYKSTMPNGYGVVHVRHVAITTALYRDANLQWHRTPKTCWWINPLIRAEWQRRDEADNRYFTGD